MTISLSTRGYLSASSEVAAAAVDAPIIAVSPVEGSVISRVVPLVITVTTDGSLRRVILSAIIGGSASEELVHNGTDFAGSYSGGANARASISNGYQFTLLRLGGWRGTSVTIRVNAVDVFGTLASKVVGDPQATYTWVVAE